MKYRGIVQKGDRRGTVLGFPTANIPYQGSESGIYAAHVTLDGVVYRAAVYADTLRKVLEAHIDKYTGGDLYGEDIEIELMKKIRDAMKFEDEGSLKAAIAADVRAVGDYFATSDTV